MTIEPTEIECESSPVDRDMVLNLLPKIEYGALLRAVGQIAPICDPPMPALPAEIDTTSEGWMDKLDEATINDLHRVLQERERRAAQTAYVVPLGQQVTSAHRLSLIHI